ncbi:MAG: DMT family transporter [Candidatus Obscuribacterales bacterium]|jgi:drug/metabolite transporter (DMT)-like permease|nr:DMT family transporter [Candidatus Obscuribacterales bacterium]
MAEGMLVNSMVILTLLFWGAWGIFDKKALGHTAPLGQLVAVYCFSPLLAVIVALVLQVWVPGWHLTEHTLFYALLGSISYFVATIAYLVAMTKGEASLILGVTASYPLIAQALAFIMLGEPLNILRVVGCVVMIAGIIVLSGSGNAKEKASTEEEKDSNFKSKTEESISLVDHKSVASNLNQVIKPADDRSVLTAVNNATGTILSEASGTPALPGANRSTAVAIGPGTVPVAALQLAAEHQPQGSDRQQSAKPSHLSLACIVCVLIAVTGWAVRGMFDKIALEHPAHPHPFEVYLGKFICDSVLGIGALIWLLKKRPEVNVFSRSLRPWAAGSAICLAGGSAAYYVALSKLSASYVIAITGCYPLFMYLLAVWVLKERFNMTRAIGIVLITLGGIITQWTQG